MNDAEEALERRLVELRAAFDGAFGLPAEPPAGVRRGYLGIRLNDVAYALDLDEVAAVRKHVPVTPLPSEEPRLLGVAGFGGVLTAVYDLAGLLGQPGGKEPVWFALARGTQVAFAFQGLEGQLSPEEGSETTPAAEDGGSSDLTWQAGLSRPVIRLRALVARLRGTGADRGTEGNGSR